MCQQGRYKGRKAARTTWRKGAWIHVGRTIGLTVKRPRLMVPTNLEMATVVRDIVNAYERRRTQSVVLQMVGSTGWIDEDSGVDLAIR